MLTALLRAAMLGLDLAKGRAQNEVRQFARQAAVGVVAFIFLLLGFSFGLAAFMVWLSGKIGTVPALGFVGFGFLVIAGLVVAIASASKKRRRRPPPIMKSVEREFVVAEAEALSAKAKSMTENPPSGATVGAVGVVGLMAFLLARQFLRR